MNILVLILKLQNNLCIFFLLFFKIGIPKVMFILNNQQLFFIWLVHLYSATIIKTVMFLTHWCSLFYIFDICILVK